MLGALGNKDPDSSLNDINMANAGDLPQDSVSAIEWAPNPSSHMFLCSGWDSKIRIYDTVIQSLQSKGIVLKGALEVEDPCLSVAWQDDMSKIFAGCINNTVKAFDTQTGQSANIGQHDGGVKDVFWIGAANMVCSVSFDKTIRFWDLRQAQPAAGYQLGYKVYCADLVSQNLVMGLSDEKLLVVNIPNIHTMLSKNQLDYIDSPLGQGSQITAVGFTADGMGVGVASHDGRANLSKLEVDQMGRPKLSTVMTFKAHKVDQGTGTSSAQQMLYPVHSIGFHPKSKQFVFTCGGEGNIFFWDYVAKNKICSFGFKGVPVTRAKMSPDGQLLAYSLGYDWAKGIEGYMSYKPKVCVHIMQENELYYSGK